MSLKTISEKLQAVASSGTAPWCIMGQVPWNPVTSKQYFGINRLHLMAYKIAPAVMTKAQAESQGIEVDKLTDQIVCMRPTKSGFMAQFMVAPVTAFGLETEVREFHLGNAIEAVCKHVKITGPLPVNADQFESLLDDVVALTQSAVADSDIPDQVTHDAAVIIMGAAFGLRIHREWKEEWMDCIRPSKLVALAHDVDERLRTYYRKAAPSDQSLAY